MRVAIIHPFLFRYARGIERFSFCLANALVEQGIEMHLLTWRWAKSVHIDALDSRVRVHAFPTSRYFAAKAIVPFYIWDLIKNKYDFIWIFFAGYGEGDALTIMRRQRFGIVFHYPVTLVPHRYREFLHYGLAIRAEQIVSVSRFVAEGAVEALGRKCTVIHHGVDTVGFAPNDTRRLQVRRALNIALDAPVLVSAAALEERKGIQWVLRALPDVVRAFPQTTFLVLGDGPYRTALENLAGELKMTEHVRFLGPQEDVAELYQTSDLSLVLARGEASSLAALESLACGVPVIATRRRPFDELIQPGYGLLVNEENASDVAHTVVSLLRNPRRRKEMGQQGRARIMADFTWAQAARKYASLMDGRCRQEPS